MKRCNLCGAIHSDGMTGPDHLTEYPFLFCQRCGGAEWEPVGDELPFPDQREQLLSDMMRDDQESGLYESE